MRTRLNAKRIPVMMLLGMLAVQMAPAQGTNEPRLSCEAPAYDFGAVFNSTNVQHTFVLKNEGGVPLTIDRVRTGCSCIKAELSDKVIPPGGSTKVTLVMSLNGWVGGKRFVSYVHSNDPQRPYLQLECSANAVSEVELEPRILIFEPGAAGAASQWVAMTNRSAVLLHVLSADPVPSVFAVRVETNLDGRLYRIGVRPTTNSANAVRGELRIVTDHPRYPKITIPLFVRGSRDPGP